MLPDDSAAPSSASGGHPVGYFTLLLHFARERLLYVAGSRIIRTQSWRMSVSNCVRSSLELTNEAVQKLTARGLFSERGRRLLRAS
jgi:hypothetical protein